MYIEHQREQKMYFSCGIKEIEKNTNWGRNKVSLSQNKKWRIYIY